MAQQTMITLVDDLDGGGADEQVEFSVDGKIYQIDLSTANGARLRSLLAPFISAGRRAGGKRHAAAATPTAEPTTSDRELNQAIRQWAIARGMKVSERGRISSNVLAAYHGAH